MQYPSRRERRISASCIGFNRESLFPVPPLHHQDYVLELDNPLTICIPFYEQWRDDEFNIHFRRGHLGPRVPCKKVALKTNFIYYIALKILQKQYKISLQLNSVLHN
jgi:hypothetical protein